MMNKLATALAFSLLATAACSDGAETSSAPAEATTSPTESHVAVIKARIAANNARDWGTWQSLHTDGAIRTAPGLPGPVVGSKAMRERIEELFTTFPDYTLELVDAFGEGDRLVVRIKQTATMKGPLDMGGGVVAPPTGKRMQQEWAAIVRFEGDKISRFDEFYDNYELLVQLGLTGP